MLERLKSSVYKQPAESMETQQPGRRSSSEQLKTSKPVWAQLPAGNFVVGAGVAIFHVKTSRVVVCFHTRDKYYFLPKGRRDVNEDTGQGAEREGYEESGYRNRLLPLPNRHQQPQPRIPTDPRISQLNTEPVWAMLMPVTSHVQYILYWYIAETLPPDVEEQLRREEQEAIDSGESVNYFGGAGPYRYPPKFPQKETLRKRMDAEPDGYEPPRHEGTSADEEEMMYHSELMSVEKALECLGSNSVMGDVVRKGWEGIEKRMEMEGFRS